MKKMLLSTLVVLGALSSVGCYKEVSVALDELKSASAGRSVPRLQTLLIGEAKEEYGTAEGAEKLAAYFDRMEAGGITRQSLDIDVTQTGSVISGRTLSCIAGVGKDDVYEKRFFDVMVYSKEGRFVLAATMDCKVNNIKMSVDPGGKEPGIRPCNREYNSECQISNLRLNELGSFPN